MYQKIILTLFIFALAIVCMGCYSARSTERSALKTARNYALENMSDLNENQLHFVRYSAPELFISPMYTNMGIASQMAFNTMLAAPLSGEEDMNNYKLMAASLMYANFVWILPNSNEVVIVSGTCRSSLRFFDPFRVVRRPIVFGDPAKKALLDKVRDYVTQDLLYIYNPEKELSGNTANGAMLNRIRLAPPLVIESSFMANGTCPEGEKEYTFLWRGEKGNDVFGVVVFATPDFIRHQIMKAKIFERNEIPANATPVSNFGELRSESEQRQAIEETHE